MEDGDRNVAAPCSLTLDSAAHFAEESQMLDWLNNYIAAQKKALDTITPADLVPLIATLREAHRAGRRIYVAGNGGSAANASHFVTDLGKNSSEAMGTPFRVMSLTDNTPWKIGRAHV